MANDPTPPDQSSILNFLKNGGLSEAMPFGAANTPQGSQTMLGNALTGVMNMPKNLIDAAKESTAHTFGPGPDTQTDSWVDPLPAESAKAAWQLARGGSTMAKSGTAGIFGGKLAKTADLDKLNFAEKMETNGSHPQEIWKATGWFKNPADNKWKFEIPDEGSRLNYLAGRPIPMSLNDAAKSAEATLKRPIGLTDPVVAGSVPVMMQHPALVKAYPELAGVRMESRYQPARIPGDTGEGMWDPDEMTAYVNAPDLNTGRSTALHELQHTIQDFEGFSPGTSPSFWARILEKHPETLSEDLRKADPWDLYKRTAGEAEARNVETRRNFTPLQRQQQHPFTTMDQFPDDKPLIGLNSHEALLNVLRKK